MQLFPSFLFLKLVENDFILFSKLNIKSWQKSKIDAKYKQKCKAK